ncbi:MAG: filamentous hemagglutinin N-terminal domain-containing protein, partial [Cyanobacteria bacterium P01_H01_bin.150]
MKGIFWLGILGITSLQILSVNPCFAQSSNIISDDSLGNEASQIEKNSQLQGLPVEIIRGGAQRGINLFHSFREFNVSEGRGAYFFSPNAEIQNILTRVTGNNRSEILGTLGTFGNSQPNLFLINPNGILFGENASLDVQGSFVGTTANGSQFGERGVFSATNPEAPGLLTVNPSALFFNQINAQASIQNNSVLRVPNGKSLVLLGGDVSMDGGGLNAYGGRIELGGLTEPGTVALD